MFKKIILPVVLLIFTQQELYGMKSSNTNTNNTSQENKGWEWKSINNYVNRDESSDKKEGNYPKLWLLWAFLDNVPFQYGGSKIWKHGEAYYGLSNGIGFFPSILNFGWLKIGIIDAHINVINLISDYLKNFIQRKIDNEGTLTFLLFPVVIHSFFNFHIFSVKILNCIKIKLVAPLTLFFVSNNDTTYLIGAKDGEKKGTAWYITYNTNNQISWWYALLSPRIEINIPGIINYFRGK